MLVKELSDMQKPRERLQYLGPAHLSNAELLAIILRVGSRKENVVMLASRMLSEHRLEQLKNYSLTQLQGIRGVGPVKAGQLQALFEMARRLQQSTKTLHAITCAKDIFDLMRPLMSTEQEQVKVVHLNAKHQVTRIEDVTTGTLNASLIHPREIFKSAIRENAHAIIVVHNHPSGDPAPSEEDREMTLRLAECARLLDIPLVDHVILGKNNHFSFCDAGLL